MVRLNSRPVNLNICLFLKPLKDCPVIRVRLCIGRITNHASQRFFLLQRELKLRLVYRTECAVIDFLLYMPNLKAIFDKYPEYRVMSTDVNGHIWSLPWIEQLGSGKKAIQTIDNMSFINKKWLDFLNLEIPETVDEFEEVLIQFRDHASELQEEFGIDGSIIPMSCIVNDGGQDPAILINGFGEGYGDADKGRHIAVTDDQKVICSATQEGYKAGIEWLHKLYEEKLIDPEAFTQEWSTYVSKGKSGRYGVCFSWDVGNIDNLKDWVPLPVLTADTRNLTPQNGSYTSGYDRGRCVVTSVAENPALVCAWLDQMYAPMQSPQKDNLPNLHL